MSDRDEKERSRERSRRERPTRFSETSRDRSSDRGRDRGSKSSSSSRVYVSNIPYEYRWQDLKDLFRSQVGDVQFVELFADDNDKSRGCGIVEFSDPQCVKKCLEVMQRFEVKGRKLIIKEDGGNVRDKHGNIVGGGGSKRARDRDSDRGYRGGGGGGGDGDRYDSQASLGNRGGSGGETGENKWGNTYGLSPHFLESLRIDTPLCSRVFVANLEYNVDKKKLKEVFRLAGRIVRVDLSVDKDGRSRGFAIVEYDHPVEAVQAISMFHNQVLNDRTMSVRIDRATEILKLPDGLKGIGMGLGTNGEPLRDVARNLPSNSQSNQTGAGAGLLGAVPNQALQVANALSGLSNLGGNFGSLAANSSMLQAANSLSLANNLLGNGLSSADLSLATNLVANATNNPMVQGATHSQVPGLSSNSANMQQSLASNNSNSQAYSTQRDNSYNSSNFGGSAGQNAGGFSSAASNRAGFQGYESKPTTGASYSFGGGLGNRDNYGGLGAGNNNLQGNNGQLMRQNTGGSLKDNNAGGGNVGGFSRKIIISNLPASASYKMLSEKFSEFGEVQHVEEKGTGSMLVVYAADWQAERAIKNLDRARIDGRTIDARLFY